MPQLHWKRRLPPTDWKVLKDSMKPVRALYPVYSNSAVCKGRCETEQENLGEFQILAD